MEIETLVGSAAAICTTVSYFPQLKKSWQTGETDDLSFKMLTLLAAGLSLWMAYGMLRSDAVIIAANGASVAMVLTIIWLKLRANSDRNHRRPRPRLPEPTTGHGRELKPPPSVFSTTVERYRR